MTVRFVLTCLHTNEILAFDEGLGRVEARLVLPGFGPYDVLHSIRPRSGDYLVSSTYGVHVVAPDLSRVVRSWSHPRLSNVHAADPLDADHVVIANTGADELLVARLGATLEVVGIFDAAAHFGLPRKLPLRDRRGEKRVSAADDHTHLNCCHLSTHAGRRVAWCALFHPGTVLAVDVERLAVVDTLRDVGVQIHSSIPVGDELWVCSSPESLVKAFDLGAGHAPRGSWRVPDRTWVRSARPFGGDLVFCGERERDPTVTSSRGYAARMDRATGELRWRIDLDRAGPFDVEPALG